ncbi:MAG: transcriptional repressor [Fimbriimonadaceae bacterium]|nr:transcriptional repressor [Fimbriimonadaceae bacterium]
MERKTRQREAICAAFQRADRPLGPHEVLAEAQQVIGGLGLATVYRAVRDLLEAGWLQPVELPGEPPRYEVAGKHHHHHFRCLQCAKVYELEGCPSTLDRLLPPGFRMTDHQIVLYGQCASCTSLTSS